MWWKKTRRRPFPLVVLTMILLNGNLCLVQSEEAQINYATEHNKTIRGDIGRSFGLFELDLKLQKDTELVFAGVEDAKKRLITKDEFIKSLSKFDRSSRLKTDEYVSEKEFLEHIANQVRPWTVDEKHRIEGVVESIADKLMRFKLNLPQKILLIKTTGKEEGRAAYCRPNAIVLPQNMLHKQNVALENLLIHELFHILSANNSKVKEALYEVINFKKCDDIKLPGKLREIKMTNPDAPKNDHYVEVQYKDRVIKVVPIIYSSAPRYDVKKGGEFFRYLKLKLLAIEKVGDNWQYKRASDGEPILLELWEVPDYFNKIGMNTNYIIHPEEVLAENFVLMVQGTKELKSEWVIEKMQNLLQSDLSK